MHAQSWNSKLFNAQNVPPGYGTPPVPPSSSTTNVGTGGQGPNIGVGGQGPSIGVGGRENIGVGAQEGSLCWSSPPPNNDVVEDVNSRDL